MRSDFLNKKVRSVCDVPWRGEFCRQHFLFFLGVLERNNKRKKPSSVFTDRYLQQLDVLKSWEISTSIAVSAYIE